MKYSVLKILSFFLAVFMLIGVCSSCAASKNNDDLFESSDIYKDTSTEDNIDTEKSTDKEGKEDKEDKQESESDKKEPSDAPEEELKAGDILVYSNKSYKFLKDRILRHILFVIYRSRFLYNLQNL